MSQTSFQDLFNAALQDYENQTGTSLINHPFSEQLEACDSVDSITSILQEQAKIFRKFKGDDGKLMKSLNCSVDVLYTLSTTILGEGIGVAFPPAKAIFTGIAVLLASIKDIRASYGALQFLFKSFENFLRRLSIYARIPPTPALTNVLVNIIVELLHTLALATKQVKQGRFKKFVKDLRGENDVEAALQRLDRLTLDEVRATTAQTLEVVCSLVPQKVDMDGGNGDGLAARISGAQESIQEVVRDDPDRNGPAASISGTRESIQEVIMDDPEGNEVATFISGALESEQAAWSKLEKNKEKCDKLRQDIRLWLSPPDPWKNHKLARESRHGRTGTWWIESDTYAEWKSSGPLLWIHGKPGAGKSVICSAIIDDVRTLQKSGLVSLAFFYCDFRDDQKKDRRGILSSLLVQLCEQFDGYFTILSEFHATHGRGSQHASDTELLECLKDMLKLPGQAPVYIIIDALDECPSTTGMPSSREKVLELVEELVNLRIPNLRICVTSRPEADILPVLETLAFHSVSLHSESGQVQDIADYVSSVVYTDREMRRWKATDKQLVVNVLTKKADGMFRWVFCQLAYLRRCIPGRILRALNELPTTLNETYARALEEIDEQNWEYAHRLFRCVAAASRPLRVNELAEFLAFDFEAGLTPAFLVDWRPEDPARTVLSTCTSLLAIVKTYDSPPIVQFAHFSVKEYLMSARLAKANETISRFHVSMTPAHTIVTQSCLGVLLHLDENVTSNGLENFPLAEYAAEHWVGHARSGSVSFNVQDGMKRLFDPSRCHLSAWISIYDPEHRRHRPEQFYLSKARARSLHYAAFFGVHDVVEFLIVERSQDVDGDGLSLHKGAPLGVAPRRRRVDIAQLPFEHGAEAEAQGDEKCTPLILTSQHGHVEVARILLKHGADREARDYKTRTPLLLATQRGHLEVARLLLNHGTDKEARDYRNRTPLLLASQRGHVELTRVLLKHGADKDARAYARHTPLHLASQYGHAEVARVLLEHGADREARDNYEYTPLLLASERGHVGVAQILLKHGADKEARNFHYERTPLLLASRHGHVEIARVLLGHGADRDARDDYGCAPSHLASRNGHVEITRVLREHGADTGAQDEGGWRPLEITSRPIHRPAEFACALLEQGADVNAKNRDSLHEVQEEEIPQFLPKHGADENEESDIRGPTLLDQAPEHGEHGSGGATRVLLEYDVNEDTEDANESVTSDNRLGLEESNSK